MTIKLLLCSILSGSLLISDPCLAQSRAISSVNILAGYSYIRLPDYRFANSESILRQSRHQSSIGISGLTSIRSWLVGATLTYLPGNLISIDSITSDSRGRSIVIEGGRVISHQEHLRIFPLIGIGCFNYRERLFTNSISRKEFVRDDYNNVLADISLNGYFIPMPYVKERESHVAPVIGFKVGMNVRIPLRLQSSEKFYTSAASLQSIYLQVIVAGFGWRGPSRRS